MKQITIILIGIIATFSSLKAQTAKEEIELLQSIIGMEKKVAVAEVITLEGEAADGFWTLYDSYESERKQHGQKRIDLLVKYAEKYETLNDETTEQLIKEMMTLGNSYNKLIQKYYKSIKKTSGIKTAAQFYQLEVYFQSAVRLSIMEQIPFIGEFE